MKRFGGGKHPSRAGIGQVLGARQAYWSFTGAIPAQYCIHNPGADPGLVASKVMVRGVPAGLYIYSLL